MRRPRSIIWPGSGTAGSSCWPARRTGWTPSSAFLPPNAHASAASGFAAGQELLASWASDLSGSLPTAVFAANDQMALGLLAAFNEAGVSVPSDISVVGFDDIAGADHFSPSLTTVHQDFTALGFKVMQATLAALGGEKPDLAPVSAQLRVRASTAAPRV